MRRSSVLKTAGIVLLSIGAAAAVGALVVRDQISRHQRNLFSTQAFKRFAALGFLSGAPASIELVQMLRDFAAWEPSPLLRRRAGQILVRMEAELRAGATAPVAADHTPHDGRPADFPTGIAG